MCKLVPYLVIPALMNTWKSELDVLELLPYQNICQFFSSHNLYMYALCFSISQSCIALYRIVIWAVPSGFVGPLKTSNTTPAGTRVEPR
jgi:hypothetical protein